MSRWYRAYAGTVTDAKLGEAALIAECSRSVSIAAWHCLLEGAAERNNCGSYEMTARRVAVILCEPVATIDALLAAFDELGLIADGAISSWKKRQFQSDDSAPRVAKHRAEKRQKTDTKAKTNGEVTARNGDVTPPETETDTYLEESPNGDRPSDDAPELKPEHVFEHYQALAGELGLAVPRDMTPERRQMIRARIAQNSLADFLTVFAKCRGSPFLRGDVKGRTPLAIDWLMKKGNFQKTMEGNYD